MEPYDVFDAIDEFAAAVSAFGCLQGDLADPATARLAHHEVEELIEERGRELLRLLFQGHLDLRARREREQPRPTAVVVTGADGQRRPYRETGHHRELACVFGTVTVERCAWRQKGLPSVHPADRASDWFLMNCGSWSPRYCRRSMPVRRAAGPLRVMSGPCSLPWCTC